MAKSTKKVTDTPAPAKSTKTAAGQSTKTAADVKRAEEEKQLQQEKRAKEKQAQELREAFVLDWVQLRDEVEDLRLRANYSLDQDEAGRVEDILEGVHQQLSHVPRLSQ